MCPVDNKPCTDPLTLSRQDLYELVWSKPVSQLATDFGISDVALAKRCKKLRVPVPGRGYWARVAAGRTPPRQPLPKPADDEQMDFPAPSELPGAEPTPTAGADALALAARVQALVLPDPAYLRGAMPPVQRLARDHGLLKSGAIAWRHARDRTGPVPELKVSDALLPRALGVANLLIAGAAELGWSFVGGEDGRCGLTVDGETVGFRLDERQKQVRNELSAEDRRRRERGEYVYMRAWDLQWSGDLRLHLYRRSPTYPDRTFQDGKRRTVEDHLCDVLLHCQTLADKIKIDKENRRLAEEERRRQEQLAREREKRADREHKLIALLERQAGAWLQARLLRAYLRAARRTLGDTVITARIDDAPVDFFGWAEGYVAQLDPLDACARNPDLDAPARHWETDRHLLSQLARLSGHEGQQSWKLLAAEDD